MTIGIIGGGASGMVAALAAAEDPQVQVLLFERQARLGRKLLATGNGRCNLTNRNRRDYHGTDRTFGETVLSLFSVEDTLSWFQKLGLYTVTEESGRVYPYSDQANSVVDVLRLALEKENITVHTGCQIQSVRKTEEGFVLESGEGQFVCHKLIVACGGLAGTKLGGSMDGYRLLGRLGHRSTRLRPALVQVKTDWKGIASLKGVRAECQAQILRDGHIFSQSTGEIQFTETALSGPVIFEISRDVCQQPGTWQCRLDLLPHISREDLLRELKCRRDRNMPAEELLTGILHNRLGRVVTKFAGLRLSGGAAQLQDHELEEVCRCVKGFELSLTEPAGMDSAQVTAGGVETDHFDPRTLESRLVPGLYVCGEVLDVDGDCGGYNLQWAWSSGYVAGRHAGGRGL